MFISMVVDPESFRKDLFDSDLYYAEARALFDGVFQNGIIILDPDKKLGEMLESKILALHTRHQQRLIILLAELRKPGKERIVCCGYDAPSERSSQSSNLALETCKLSKPDGFVSIDDKWPDECDYGCTIPVALSKYSASSLEKDRRWFHEEVPPLNEMSRRKVDDLFAGVIRYSKCLRLYDYIIGKTSDLAPFLKGIEYILKLWQRRGYFPLHDCKVEIYTIFHRTAPDAAGPTGIKRDLLEQLSKRFPCRFEAYVKVDDRREFDAHARYLQTQVGIVGIERGFDFLYANGRFKPCDVALKDGCSNRLRLWRDLPDQVKPMIVHAQRPAPAA